MKKVLVIGAHSYIGQKFKEYVSKKNEQDIIVDLISASDGAWKQVDFSLYDTVLHLSGIVHRKEKKNMKSLYDSVNHLLAVEVARKSKENHVKQFIFMSTAAIYGSSAGCITNKTMPNPTTYYGKSKLAAEQDIMKLNDGEFHVAILRPPMVYGDGCKGNYPRLVKLARYTLIFPEYHNKRSILHIDTLLDYLIEMIGERCGYFHPQDEKYGDICSMIIIIRKAMGKKTILVKYFNFIIGFLTHHINIFDKIFGDLYYSKNIS